VHLEIFRSNSMFGEISGLEAFGVVSLVAIACGAGGLILLLRRRRSEVGTELHTGEDTEAITPRIRDDGIDLLDPKNAELLRRCNARSQSNTSSQDEKDEDDSEDDDEENPFVDEPPMLVPWDSDPDEPPEQTTEA
jgi:hypothetical protein